MYLRGKEKCRVRVSEGEEKERASPPADTLPQHPQWPRPEPGTQSKSFSYLSRNPMPRATTAASQGLHLQEAGVRGLFLGAFSGPFS